MIVCKYFTRFYGVRTGLFSCVGPVQLHRPVHTPCLPLKCTLEDVVEERIERVPLLLHSNECAEGAA